ncbi:MAG TPA: EAL domain-containing protein [Thiobacillus sp.]
MIRHSFIHSLHSPLARRLIVAMVLFSVVVTLITTGFQVYREYQRNMIGVEQQFTQIDAVHIPSLTQSVWVANNKEIRLQLEGIMRVPNVVYAAVDGQQEFLLEAGKRDTRYGVERRYEMQYRHLGQSRNIGTLIVKISLDNIYTGLLDDAIGVLINNALYIFLVALFIFVLFYRLITRHLVSVANHLRQANPSLPANSLTLSRETSDQMDELDVLVNSVNDMQNKTRTALMAARDSKAHVRLLLDSTSEAIFGTNTQGICTFANQACLDMLGYAQESDLVGKRIHDLIHHTYPDGRPYPAEECGARLATLAGHAHHCDDEVHWRADGSSFPVEYRSRPMYQDGELVGSVVTFNDISQRKQAEEALHQLAYFDSLTQLPNRQLFNDRLHQAIGDAKRRNKLVALMLLDLDRFKVINDTMGHEAGDMLLQEIASRLKLSIRANDTVSRLGGDEFALVFTDVGESRHVVQLAQKLLAQFNTPIMINGREVFSGASIGIALYPSDTHEPDELLKYADSAMYHAKELGRNNYQFYSAEMTSNADERLHLEASLRRAIEQHEFVLHYQPLVDARSNLATGLEALIRWNDPSGKMIPPDQFIPLAEDTGLIVPIGKWVLETACAQLKIWHDAGHPELKMSVNVATRQFRDAMFTETVRHAILSAGIPAESLELEITESILLENSEGTLNTLNALKSLGVSLAIDDFGTGYSSLSYLKRFPIDRVKIDRSFVRDLATDTDDLAIVRAIIALAQAMRLSVIAEGVETEAQLALLQSEKCHDYQGYFYARPMDAASISGKFLQAPSIQDHAQRVCA